MSTKKTKIMRIALTVPNRERLAKLIRGFQLDIGGGGPRRQSDGSLRMEAYVPEELLDKLTKAGGVFNIIEDATQVGKERQKEVGRGDRFEGGKKTPHGLGKKE